MKKQVSLREEAREEKRGKFTKLNHLVKSNGRKQKVVIVVYTHKVTAKIKKPGFFFFCLQNDAPETRFVLF